MSDRMTTFRSGYYRRAVPYAGQEQPIDRESQGETVLRRAKEATDKFRSVPIVGQQMYDANVDLPKRREALLQTNPWLEAVLDEVVKARLGMYNSDEEWAKSKKYGWAESHAPDMPLDSEHFSISYDPETGKFMVDDTDAALDLMMADKAKYDEARKPYEDWVNTPYITLTPSTREDAEAKGLGFYPTTNDYLEALVATKLGEDNRQALYDLAQMRFAKMLMDDSKSESPKYGSIIGRFLTDPDPEGNRGMRQREFDTNNAVKVGLANMVAPVTSAVAFDPELSHKTTDTERAVRALADLGLNVATVALPFGGAARGALMAGRTGAIAGGAAGGLANYALGRGVNQGFAMATGRGTDEYPIDVTDAAIESGIGAVFGPVTAANRVKGVTKIRSKMNPREPHSVKYSDIKASVKASKKNPTNPDVAESQFRGSSFDKYDKNYKNQAMQAQMAPVPEAEGLKLATGLPYGNLNSYPVTTSYNDLIKGKQAYGVVPKSGPNTNKVINPKKQKSRLPNGKFHYEEVPEAWAYGDDPEFVSKYVKEHPEYFDKDFSGENLAALGSILKRAQVKGSPESRFFTGRTESMKGKDFAKQLAQFRGNTIDDANRKANDMFADILSKKSTPGTMDSKGNFVKADEKQEKMYRGAMKDYSRRANQNMVSKSDLRGANSLRLRDIPYKVGGGGLSIVSKNVIPFGSNVLMDVPPVKYEQRKEK